MKAGRHLITGGAGMIGSHLARRLVNMGCPVTVVDDLSSGSYQNIKDLIGKPGFEFINADLRVPEYCDILCQNKEYAWGFSANMGGIFWITEVSADVMFDNTRMNVNMLLAAHKNKVHRYLYSSSACVYASYKQTDAEVVALKEADAMPADPNEAYGWEKLYCEQLVDSMIKDYGSDIRVARFHNIYGTGFTAFDKDRGKAPCHLILKAIRHPNLPFDIWGTGEATRSFCYIDDCIDAIILLMESDYNKPINIGTDRLVTINELADIIIKISGKDIKPVHDLTKPVGVMGRNADLSLCEQILGWRPKVDLEEGLKQVYWWAVENYDRLENIK